MRVDNRAADAAKHAEALTQDDGGAAGYRSRVIEQLPSAHQLHRKEVLPLRGLAGLIDGGDAWMLQSAEGSCLTFEEPDAHRVERRAVDHFERHATTWLV